MLIVYLVFNHELPRRSPSPTTSYLFQALLLAACVDAKYGKSTEEECTTSDK